MPAPRSDDAPFQANLYVVGRFLDRLSQSGKSWTKASLQAACGVNYDIFRRYLALLEGKCFVVVSEAGRVALTKQGSAMRDQLRGLLAEFLASPPGTDAPPAPRAAPRSDGPGAGTRSPR